MCVADCCSVLQSVAARCSSICSCVLLFLLRSMHSTFLHLNWGVCCSPLPCVAGCCRVLHSVAVCCSELQCVAVSCSVLQCVAVCCSSMLHCCVADSVVVYVFEFFASELGSVLQCIAVYCSVLQCVAACCALLQFCVAVFSICVVFEFDCAI